MKNDNFVDKIKNYDYIALRFVSSYLVTLQLTQTISTC